jgi:hypothetical protein
MYTAKPSASPGPNQLWGPQNYSVGRTGGKAPTTAAPTTHSKQLISAPCIQNVCPPRAFMAKLGIRTQAAINAGKNIDQQLPEAVHPDVLRVNYCISTLERPLCPA